MVESLPQSDRLWLGAHGDQRFAGEWADMQRREDTLAQIERTRVKMRELDEAGVSYDVICLPEYADPIGVHTYGRGNE